MITSKPVPQGEVAGSHSRPAELLSSYATIFYKYVLPVVVLLPIVAAPLIGAWPLAIPFVVVEIYLLMLGVPLKDVVLEERYLVVSGFRRTHRIPCSLIEGVSENRLQSVRPVWIFFSAPTPFGRRISFLPKGWVVLFWKPHPVLEVLREAARSARSMESGRAPEGASRRP